MEIAGMDHLPAYTIVEEGSVLRSLFQWLRLRALFPLTLTVTDLQRGDRYTLHRPNPFGRWILIRKNPSTPLVTFERKKIYLGPVPLFYSFSTRLIFDPKRKEIGRVIKKNPFLVGSQRGTLLDGEGERIGEFEWGQYAWTKGYERCGITIAHEDPFWELIGISSAIIWGMELLQR